MFTGLFILFSSESGFMCVEAEKKSGHILTLRIGRLSRNRDEACSTNLFFDGSVKRTTLISE